MSWTQLNTQGLIARGEPAVEFSRIFEECRHRPARIVRSGATAGLDDCLADYHLAAGVHAGYSVLAGLSLFPGVQSPELTEREKFLLDAFGDVDILAIYAGDYENNYGYAYYSHGRKRRCMAGDGETGIHFDWGAPLPGERPEYDEMMAEPTRLLSEGEELVLAATRIVLPMRIDEWCALESPVLERFEEASRSRPE